jgi:hypothetical protein
MHPNDAPVTELYCDDDDLLRAAPQDFVRLIPGYQAVARGEDGHVPDGFPLRVASASVDFVASGVRADMVATLRESKGQNAADVLVVDDVAVGYLDLRRPGMAAGEGAPIGTAGVTTGLAFRVLTATAQIRRATDQLNLDYGLDATIDGKMYSDVYNPNDLREAAVAMVLYSLYSEMAPQANTPNAQGWWAKAGEWKKRMEFIAGRSLLRWRDAAGDVATSAGMAQMRVVR